MILRFYKDRRNVIDKYTNESILCYNEEEAEKNTNAFNKLYLKIEKLEAKERALNL